MERGGYQLSLGDKVFAVFSDETILQCICRNNIDVNYRCTSGYCGCCKVKLISGNVDLDHSGGISREEIAAGFILSCCSFPTSDVTIELEV